MDLVGRSLPAGLAVAALGFPSDGAFQAFLERSMGMLLGPLVDVDRLLSLLSASANRAKVVACITRTAMHQPTCIFLTRPSSVVWPPSLLAMCRPKSAWLRHKPQEYVPAPWSDGASRSWTVGDALLYPEREMYGIAILVQTHNNRQTKAAHQVWSDASQQAAVRQAGARYLAAATPKAAFVAVTCLQLHPLWRLPSL